MKQKICCICYEYENIIACISCDFCKDGIICCDCLCEYDNLNNPFYLHCPCCRYLFINHSKRNIIFCELLYYLDNNLENYNCLINRWINNFINTDLYEDLYKNRRLI
jgi:hypothetical protein